MRGRVAGRSACFSRAGVAPRSFPRRMASLGGRRNPRGGRVRRRSRRARARAPAAGTWRLRGWRRVERLDHAHRARRGYHLRVLRRPLQHLKRLSSAMAEAISCGQARRGRRPERVLLRLHIRQIVGGRAADRFGGKNVLLFGVVAWSLATFSTRRGGGRATAPLLLARVSLGAGEGVAFPAVHALIARRPARAAHHRGGHGHGGVLRGRGVRVRRDPRLVLAGGWGGVLRLRRRRASLGPALGPGEVPGGHLA